MNSQKFERELKKLIYYVREYGIQHLSFPRSELGRIRDDNAIAEEFLTQVHKGFYLAQERVIELLRKVINEQKRAKSDIAEARRNRDKPAVKSLQAKRDTAHYQECILRRVIDTIVWTLCNRELATIRRLYMEQEPIDITDSNLDSELSFLDRYKQSHPAGFALISDLSMIVQVGDIITKDISEGMGIVELKEGRVNERVFEIMSEYRENHCDHYLASTLSAEGEKVSEQFFRSAKQLHKEMLTVKILNEGHGEDPQSGKAVTVVESKLELATFNPVFCDVIKRASQKGRAAQTIQGCLTIVAFDTTHPAVGAVEPGDVPLDRPSKDKKKTEEDTSIRSMDLRQTLIDPTTRPLFLYPLSENSISDIAMERTIVKFYLDVPAWLQMFKDHGFTVRMLGRKETARIKQQEDHGTQILEVDGRGVEIQKGKYKSLLGAGLLARMFTCLNTPLSMVDYFTEMERYFSAL